MFLSLVLKGQNTIYGFVYEDIANSNKNVVSKRINKVHPNLKYTSLKDL